jgi:amicoumacin kinase
MTKEKMMPLNGGLHNEVFYLPDEELVLRISETGKTTEMVLQEIEWMTYLKENGIKVPGVKQFNVKSGRPQVFFEYKRGEPIDVRNKQHWNKQTFLELGSVLGHMHALSKTVKKKLNNRPEWSAQNTDVFRIEKSLQKWLAPHYQHWMDCLSDFAKKQDTFGLIHNDFHQGNVLVRPKGELVIIDFDECSYNWFAQDLAAVFYHAYWQHQSFNGDADGFIPEFLHSLFEGYQKWNVLHKDILVQIPVFLKLREIFLYQLFMRKWNIEQLEDWQAFTLTDLKRRIESREPYAGIADFSIFIHPKKQ